MDAQAILTVSAAVVALVQLAKWAGVDDSKGPMAVLMCSLFGVAFWGWASGTFIRTVAFDYFAGWIAVMTSAAGVFGFTRSTGDSLVRMRGTGDGGGMDGTTSKASPETVRLIEKNETTKKEGE